MYLVLLVARGAVVVAEEVGGALAAAATSMGEVWEIAGESLSGRAVSDPVAGGEDTTTFPFARTSFRNLLGLIFIPVLFPFANCGLPSYSTWLSLILPVSMLPPSYPALAAQSGTNIKGFGARWSVRRSGCWEKYAKRWPFLS